MTDQPNGDLEHSSVTENLALAAADAKIFGWSSIFQEDDDTDEDASQEPAALPPLVATTVRIRGENFRILQATTGFGSSGKDTTGHVLWGAACCLADHLASLGGAFKGKTVVELGCGLAALPSQLVAKLGDPEKVIATDVSRSSLEGVGRHVTENNIRPNVMEARQLDWDDNAGLQSLNSSVDILLAADVIYGVDAVPALVRTIHCLLAKEAGILYLTTRDGRRGIPEFQTCMKDSGLEFIQTQTWRTVPATIESNEEGTKSRWQGSHTLYIIYQHK
jgi:predicted nicotinamide N-methyase